MTTGHNLLSMTESSLSGANWLQNNGLLLPSYLLGFYVPKVEGVSSVLKAVSFLT